MHYRVARRKKIKIVSQSSSLSRFSPKNCCWTSLRTSSLNPTRLHLFAPEDGTHDQISHMPKGGWGGGGFIGVQNLISIPHV